MEITNIGENFIDNVIPKKILDQIKDIFFESAAIKNFSSDKARDDFYYRWCGTYLEHWPTYCMVAVDEDRVVGYLVGCPDSTQALDVLTMPGYSIFSEYFGEFPAHLHMNVHASTRGSGIGKQLVDYFCQDLSRNKIHGVFIITAAMSRPTSFYMKNDFNYSYTKEYGSSALILMGKKL